MTSILGIKDHGIDQEYLSRQSHRSHTTVYQHISHLNYDYQQLLQ